MHPIHHAESTARKYGGQAADYLAIHEWFDQSKAHMADFRHRALRHHSEGIFAAEALFGRTITNSDGRAVPVRYIGEQHVLEDLGRIPTIEDWYGNIMPEPWMFGQRPKETTHGHEHGQAEEGGASPALEGVVGAVGAGGGGPGPCAEGEPAVSRAARPSRQAVRKRGA